MFRFRSSTAALWFASLIAVAPLVVIPYTGIDPVSQKGILAAFGLGVALLVLFFELAVLGRSVQTPRMLGVLLAFPFLTAVTASFMFSGMSKASLWGNAFDMGTVSSVVLFWFSVVAGASLSRRAAGNILHLVTGTVLVAVALSALFVELFPAVLNGATVAGVWTNISFLAAGTLALALSVADVAGTRILRIVYSVASVLLAVGFLFFFERTAATVLVSVLAVVVLMRFRMREQGSSGTRTIPWTGIAGIACFLLLLLSGVTHPILTLGATGRPSLLATELVAVPEATGSLVHAVIGSGPATFSQVWEEYRPVEFNTSQYWDTRVDEAYSTALTFVVTLGILGLLTLYTIPAWLLLEVIAARARDAFADVETTARLFGAFAFMLFSFAALAVTTAGPLLFLLGGLLSGCFVALLQGDIPRRAPEKMYIRILVGGASALVGGVFLWVSVHAFIAGIVHARAVQTPVAGAKEETLLLVDAATLWPTVSHQQDASVALLLNILGAESSGVDATTTKNQIDRALSFASESVQTDPGDVRAWISRASLYIRLLASGRKEYEQNGRDALQGAEKLAPNRPDIPYLWGVLEMRAGNPAEAQNQVEQSLSLKPDYKEAKALQQQVAQPAAATTTLQQTGGNPLQQ